MPQTTAEPLEPQEQQEHEKEMGEMASVIVHGRSSWLFGDRAVSAGRVPPIRKEKKLALRARLGIPRQVIDQGKLPRSGLLARNNFRLPRHPGTNSESSQSTKEIRLYMELTTRPGASCRRGRAAARAFVRRHRLSLLARRLCRSDLLGAFLQFGLCQVYVSYRLRDDHSAAWDLVIM